MGKQSRLRAIRRGLAAVSDTPQVQLHPSDAMRFSVGQCVRMAGVRNVRRKDRQRPMYVRAVDYETGIVTLSSGSTRP